MEKNLLKFTINLLLFVDLCSVGVIGLLLAFIIPRGGPRSGDSYFLGLHRHAWADLHLYLALVFFLMLFVHVFLNWRWVVQSYKRYLGVAWRKGLVVTAGAWILVLMVGWVLAKL